MGINKARFSSDLKVEISSFHKEASMEAWNKKSTPINSIHAIKMAITYLFIFHVFQSEKYLNEIIRMRLLKLFKTMELLV